MSYFFEGAFKDKDNWKKILILITLMVAFIDLRFAFFDGKVFWTIVILSTLSLIALGIRIAVKDKKGKNLANEQKLFEGRMRKDIKDRIRANPEFQTFCFECSNFDNERRACKISFYVIDKRALKTKLADNKFEYCLYWKDRYK